MHRCASARPTRHGRGLAGAVSALVLAMQPATSLAQAECGSMPTTRLSAQGAIGQALPARGADAPLARWVRIDPAAWSLHVYDMRHLREQMATRGNYESPAYTLQELASELRNRALVSTAGLTDSLMTPVPVGLLVVNGQVRNRLVSSSRILRGIVCARPDRSISILTASPTGTFDDARMPWRSCTQGVQSGPLIMRDGSIVTDAGRTLRVARVFIATTRDGTMLLGHAPKASEMELACTLSAPELGVRSVLLLQGHTMGSIIVGGAGADLPREAWGNPEATVASALWLVRR